MLCVLVNTRFQVLFHSPLGVLFTFPSQYCFTIGHWVVFRLGGWAPRLLCGFHVSADTLDTANFITISPTGLSPSSVDLPMSFCYTHFLHVAVRNPKSISTLGLASFAFARHYSRNLGWFLFLCLLRCFSSAGSPDVPMYSVRHYTSSTCRVSSFGYPRIEAYLQLPVAFRSLSRPSSAPSAKAFSLRSFSLELPWYLFSSFNYVSFANRFFLLFCFATL